MLSTPRPLWPQQPLPPALSHLNRHSSDTLSGSGVPVTKCHIRNFLSSFRNIIILNAHNSPSWNILFLLSVEKTMP